MISFSSLDASHTWLAQKSIATGNCYYYSPIIELNGQIVMGSTVMMVLLPLLTRN